MVAGGSEDCELTSGFQEGFNPLLEETARHELGFVRRVCRLRAGAGVAAPRGDRVPKTESAPIEARGAGRGMTGREGDRDRKSDASPRNRDGLRRPGKPVSRALPCAGEARAPVAGWFIDIEGTRTFIVLGLETPRGPTPRVVVVRLEASAPEPRAHAHFHADYVTNYAGFEWLFFPTRRPDARRPGARRAVRQNRARRRDRAPRLARHGDHRDGVRHTGSAHGRRHDFRGDAQEAKSATCALGGRHDPPLAGVCSSPAPEAARTYPQAFGAGNGAVGEGMRRAGCERGVGRRVRF